MRFENGIHVCASAKKIGEDDNERIVEASIFRGPKNGLPGQLIPFTDSDARAFKSKLLSGTAQFSVMLNDRVTGKFTPGIPEREGGIDIQIKQTSGQLSVQLGFISGVDKNSEGKDSTGLNKRGQFGHFADTLSLIERLLDAAMQSLLEDQPEG
jgi:hypothetical protein